MNEKPAIFADYPDVVTPEDLSKMLHIGRIKVYQLLRTKAIRSIRIDAKYVIPKLWVIEFLEKNG